MAKLPQGQFDLCTMRQSYTSTLMKLMPFVFHFLYHSKLNLFYYFGSIHLSPIQPVKIFYAPLHLTFISNLYLTFQTPLISGLLKLLRTLFWILSEWIHKRMKFICEWNSFSVLNKLYAWSLIVEFQQIPHCMVIKFNFDHILFVILSSFLSRKLGFLISTLNSCLLKILP